MTTGEKIKAARKAAGMTQIELADALGVSKTYISKYENDTRKPKRDTLLKIADKLGVRALDLEDDTTVNAYYEGAINQSVRLSMGYLGDLYHGAKQTPFLSPLLDAFASLNEEGQQKAVERVEELTEIPKYQNVELLELIRRTRAVSELYQRTDGTTDD
jgi:transcriptional regulator with XRE-family HTH domain